MRTFLLCTVFITSVNAQYDQLQYQYIYPNSPTYEKQHFAAATVMPQHYHAQNPTEMVHHSPVVDRLASSLTRSPSTHLENKYMSHPKKTVPSTKPSEVPVVPEPMAAATQASPVIAPVVPKTSGIFGSSVPSGNPSGISSIFGTSGNVGTSGASAPTSPCFADGRSVTIDNMRITPDSLLQIAKLAQTFGSNPDWRRMKFGELRNFLELTNGASAVTAYPNQPTRSIGLN